MQENQFVLKLTSLSKIRKLIQNGQLKPANDLLGRNWCITGTVEKGKQQGREIGFPTANIKMNNNKLIPGNGVYFVKANLDGDKFLILLDLG